MGGFERTTLKKVMVARNVSLDFMAKKRIRAKGGREYRVANMTMASSNAIEVMENAFLRNILPTKYNIYIRL